MKMEEIFIRELKKSERGNPTRSINKIEKREGYEIVYKPYGANGKGFYYINKLDLPPFLRIFARLLSVRE
jgi:hypothetical protein